MSNFFHRGTICNYFKPALGLNCYKGFASAFLPFGALILVFGTSANLSNYLQVCQIIILADFKPPSVTTLINPINCITDMSKSFVTSFLKLPSLLGGS